MVTKTCKICGEPKEAVQGTWVISHGEPQGRKCHACKLTLQNIANGHKSNNFDMGTLNNEQV